MKYEIDKILDDGLALAERAVAQNAEATAILVLMGVIVSELRTIIYQLDQTKLPVYNENTDW